MKKNLLLIIFAALALGSCKKYKNKEVYANVPVYMDYDSFRSSFSFEVGVPITGAGNIFVYNQFIFLSEEDKGIHIINNSNNADPIVQGFMNIPGNTQMAVKGNYLYANSFIDLLVIDLSDINNPQLVNRIKDVFEYATPAINDTYPVADVHKDRGVVVSWKIEKTKEVSGFMNKYFVSDCDECEQTELQTKNSSSMPTTLSGSMSKFAIDEDYLYIIDDNNLMAFSISNPTTPLEKSNKPTYKEVETLFNKDGYLYLGTTTGLAIYDARNSPTQPTEEGGVEHVESCDPVFVSGDYAFVTLRSGNDCGGQEDELQIIDVSNKKLPKFKKRFDMTNPHGLSVDNNLLFICDGDAGLRVFDASNPLKVGDNELYHFGNISAKDIILNNGVAILIADHGIYQYNYSNPANLQYISSLNF